MSDTEPDKKQSFQTLITSYSDCVDSLLITFPGVMGIMARELKSLSKQLNDYLSRHGDKIKEEDGVSTYNVKGKTASKAAKLRRLLDNAHKAYALVHRGFLISLISQYDAYLGRLIRLHFYTHPERLDASEKQFAFKDLVNLGSIEEARESLIEREVDTVIRKSHDEQLEWIH
jgi:predicted RNA-binding protein with PIN domain